MKRQEGQIGRRDFLRRITASMGVAVGASALPQEVPAEPRSADEKRKARYRANSEDVQSFYRVNRYPPQ
jgi:hypothetical protein